MTRKSNWYWHKVSMKMATGATGHLCALLALIIVATAATGCIDDSTSENQLMQLGVTHRALQQSDFSIWAQIEGEHETNFLKPRLYLVNGGSTSLTDFEIHFYFTVENGKTPILEDWYTPNSSVRMEEVSGDLYRLVYDFTGYTLAPGATVPNEGGNVVGLHYNDWSEWDRNNDYSANGLTSYFAQTSYVVVTDSNGTIVYGEPPLAAGTTKYLLGATSEELKQRNEELSPDGFRLTSISGYEDSGVAKFSAVWKIVYGPEWTWFHGVNWFDLQTKLNQLSAEGYKPVIIDGYTIGGTLFFNAVFDKSAVERIQHTYMTDDLFSDLNNQYQQNGFRLVHACGYKWAEMQRYAGVWEKTYGPEQVMMLGLTENQYRVQQGTMEAQGYELYHLDGYMTDTEPNYVAIWNDEPGLPYSVKTNLPPYEFQRALEDIHYQGFEPDSISVFGSSGSLHLAGRFENAHYTHAQLQSIDDVVALQMTNLNMRGLSLAVSQNGRLKFAKGYGIARSDLNIPADTRTRFRWASVSKALTAAMVLKFEDWDIQNGTNHLQFDAPVFAPGGLLHDFCPVSNTSPTGHECSDTNGYINLVTLRHLLNHTEGGWEKASLSTIMPTMSREDRIRYVLEQSVSGGTYELTIQPGTTWQYSNFGYVVLGRAIERLTAAPTDTYEDIVKTHFLNPAGAASFNIGLPKGALWPDEARYYKDGNDTTAAILMIADAAGDWVGTPIDLLRWEARVDTFPTPADLIDSSLITNEMLKPWNGQSGGYGMGRQVHDYLGADFYWTHGGAMAGTRSMLRTYATDNVSCAIVVNETPSADFDRPQLIEDIKTAVGTWPDIDLF